MKASVFRGLKNIQIENVPDPKIKHAGDAIVRVTHACICGSDLWFYRGVEAYQPGARTGHEFMGVIEEVGKDVKSFKKGDRVIAPFMYSDGVCEYCKAGFQTSCTHGGFWGGEHQDGGQGEVVRVPFAEGTLVALPSDIGKDEAMLKAVLPLTDVMGTGHHCARCADVGQGKTVAVVGDGAVGLCGVLAAKRLGAERIIILGHQPERLKMAETFGATDIVSERGEAALAHVMEITGGGAHSVMECVGTQEARESAIQMARPGGSIGYVGVPQHNDTLKGQSALFMKNLTFRGGVAPVRRYLPELLADVLAGRLDPSPVLDKEVTIDGIPEGYAAMDNRSAIKVMVRV